MDGLVRPLFPELVHVAEMDPRTADPAVLLPEEAACVTRAVEKRRREFAAGRAMARRLLGALGWPSDVPLLPGARREPCWPAGVLGTISHTDTWATVAVARASECEILGVDVERDAPLKDEVAERICNADELAWIRDVARDPETRGRWAKLVFSAKEAAYKAQYPHSQTFLGFDAMGITFDPEAETFVARFRVDAPPFAVGESWTGRFRCAGALLATGICLPRVQPSASATPGR